MPIHDWSHAPPGYFHHFHQCWSVHICAQLNDGRLPEGYFALIEQHAPDLVPDVLTLQQADDPPPRGGGLAVADAPPRARFVVEAEEDLYVQKANRVTVRTALDRVVAIIEIVSPGNKYSRASTREFVEKAVDFLRRGINLLVIDVLPPSRRDPQGLHKLIWDEIRELPFELPEDKRLTLAAYAARMPLTAYVEPVGVGDPLPEMPVFIAPERYVPAPLEPSYALAWRLCPKQFREAVLPSSGPGGGPGDA